MYVWVNYLNGRVGGWVEDGSRSVLEFVVGVGAVVVVAVEHWVVDQLHLLLLVVVVILR